MRFALQAEIARELRLFEQLHGVGPPPDTTQSDLACAARGRCDEPISPGSSRAAVSLQCDGGDRSFAMDEAITPSQLLGFAIAEV